MSFKEKQPDNRLYVSNGMYHITPVIEVNKFDPHNYNIKELLELGETGLSQYKECRKENIPSEYLGGCKDGLYKMYKALGYYSLVNEEARELKNNIDNELSITQQANNQQSNLNAIFSDVTRDNMHNKSVYANTHTRTYQPSITEQQRKQYENMMLPRD